MRALKIAGWTLLGVVGLFALAMLLVAWLVDPNDYKDEITAAVKAETRRDLELQGALKLSVFPWLALELGPARLGNPVGFGPGPFVSIDRADVGVRLFPLLRGQLEVRKLRLEGLQLNLVTDERGRTNWQDLAGESAGAAAESGESHGALPDIAGLTIRNAALDYRDLGAGSYWRLRDLNLETGRLRDGKPFDVDFAFTLDQGEKSARTGLRMRSNVTLDTRAKRYAFKDLALDATLRSAETEKDEMQVAVKLPTLDIDVGQQTLAAPQFAARVAGADVSGSLTGKQIVDAPALSGTIALEPMSPRDLLRALDAEIPRTRDPKALSLLACEARLEATDKSIAFEELKLTLDDTRMTGRAGIEDLDTMALRFDLTVDQLDLDRYQAPEEKDAKPDAEPEEIPVKSLEALNARGTLAVGTLTLAGIRMSAVKLSVDAKDGLVRVNPSQAKLYGGAHRGSVTLDTRGSLARLSIDERLSGVDFAGLLDDLFDSKRLSGRGSATAVLAARGNTADAILRSLDGRVDFEVVDGALEGTDLWYELRRARALWKRESPPAQASTGRTVFHALKGSATIARGVLENRDLAIDTDYLKVAGAGTLNFDSQALDYRLQANLYRIPPEGAGAEMQELKAAEIPIRLSGTLEQMQVRPDFEALAKAQAKQKVEEKKQELTDKLKDKLDKWLGGRQE